MIQGTLRSALTLFALAAPLAPTGRAQEAFPAATPESQGLSSASLEGLAAELQGFVDRDLIVGGELLVIKNRHTVLQRAFGSADREREIPWTVGTVCNVRSMTKTLTGAAAQILIDREQISLDDPAALYLPGFDTDEAREITLRQVIAHRAGLPLTILESMTQFEDLVAMADGVGAVGPEYPPDSRFWYSDAGTEVLGAVVQLVADRPLDRFVVDELLEPLGMSESFYDLDGEDPRRERIASLYIGGVNNWNRFWSAEEEPFYPFAWGSQSLYSTPRDYAKFLAMWMDRGRVGERVILSEAAVARTLTPLSEMSMLGSAARFPTSYRGLEVFYGQMAVLHVPVAAKGAGPATIVGHSGSDGTIAWAWPERDLMVLFFTQSRGGSAVLRLEESIDRLIVNPEAYADEPQVPEELQPLLGTYVADFASHMKEEFVVLVKNGKLTLDIPSQMAFELVPAAEPGRWTFAITDAVNVGFTRDEAGVVDCLEIQQGGMTFQAPRAGSPLEREMIEANRPDPKVVGKYLGSYHDPEQEIDAEVFIDGDYLAVRSGEDDLFHLWEVPGQDVWLVREMPTMTVSFQEEDGAVVSLTRRSGQAATVMPRVD